MFLLYLETHNKTPEKAKKSIIKFVFIAIHSLFARDKFAVLIIK